MAEILPYDRNGAWGSSHAFYYQCAWRAFEDYGRYLTQLRAKELELEEEYKDEDPDVFGWSIRDGTKDLWDRCYQSSVSAQLYCCMAFEGFLNNYGVRRLGEKFYKRHLERCGITEKVTLLVLSCERMVLDGNSELLRKVRRLFDDRNRLVHPKAAEIDLDRLATHVLPHPENAEVTASMALLDEVIDAFCALDRSLDRRFEFPKTRDDYP